MFGDVLQRFALDRGGFQSRVEHGVVQGGFEHVALHLVFVFEIALFLALFDLEQRRLGDVHMTSLDELGHLTVEEGEQQGADVRTVHVRVGHDDDAVVAQFLSVVFLFADAGTQHGDEDGDLLRGDELLETCFFHVQDLAL